MMIMRILSLMALLVCIVARGLAADHGYAEAISVQTVLKTSADAVGQPIHYPQGGAEVTGVIVKIPPGQNTGWHVHPHPCVAYVLEGEITVEFAGGQTRQLKAGDAVAEAVNVKHCGYNRSTNTAKILMFAIGEKNAAISQQVEK
jgi:quercetin dioxygenase-like cupin family protein